MLFPIWMIAGGVFGIVTGWLAVGKNRPALPWWVLGVLIGPFAIVALQIRGPRPPEMRPAML